MGATSYRELEVWAKAMDVAQAIYVAADRMPKKEEYRLTSQMIRAAVSIPANIAARSTRKDYAHFISIARGTSAELETLLMLAQRAKHLPAEITEPLLDQVESVSRMLNRLHARLKEAP